MTKEEFKNLILPSKEKLFRTALTLLHNRQEAEDTLQDAMVKLWEIRHSLHRYRSVEALAVTMTRNLCIDKLRSYRHRKQDETGLDSVSAVSDRLSPDRKTEINETMNLINEIFEALPEQQRLVIQLRDVEQYSYDEIREITGLTVNNIRVALSRARKQVRDEFLKHQNYEHRKN